MAAASDPAVRTWFHAVQLGTKAAQRRAASALDGFNGASASFCGTLKTKVTNMAMPR